MTDKELATLTRLFREIERKTEDEVLSFKFVVGGLQTISGGKEIPTVLYTPGPVGVLIFKHSLIVEASQEIALEIEDGIWRCRVINGYNIPPSLDKPTQPATAGGDGAILETVRRATLFDFAQELLNEPVTREFSFEKKLFDQGISFSLPQVFKILDSGLPNANKRKSRIFFIHDSDCGVCAVSVSSAHSQLYPRDWDGAYSYTDGTNVMVRNVPKHFQPK